MAHLYAVIQKYRTQTGQLIPTDLRDIPSHLVSYSAYKAGRTRRHGRTFKVMASSPVTVTRDGTWLGMAEPREVVNALSALLIYTGFALPM